MSFRAPRFTFLNALLALLLAQSGLTARPTTGAKTPASASADDTGAYDVLVQTSQEGGGSRWTYTITKAATGAKDLGHFIINFANCGEQSPSLAHITSATVNGVDWAGQIEGSEGR